MRNFNGIVILITLSLIFPCFTYAEPLFAKEKTSFRETSCLIIENIHDDGLALELNDGSIWDIHYYGGPWRLLGWGWTEKHEISEWNVGDHIEIFYPGSGNFIDFVLIISNQTKNEHAIVKLKTPPSVDYAGCLWVVENHQKKKMITLNNGTSWLIKGGNMYGSFFDSLTSSSGKLWGPGDPLTFVFADTMFSSTLFLWNHATDEIVEVEQN